MATRVLLLLALLLCACTSFQKHSVPTDQASENSEESFVPPPLSQNDWKERYVGLSGYLIRPPMFVDLADQSRFQRCRPVTVENVQKEKAFVMLTLKQGNNHFAIKGLNRKLFHLNSSERLSLLDRFILKKLDVTGAGRMMAVAGNKLCEGQFAQKMPKKEFLFLSGDPDDIKKQNTSAGPMEELVYHSGNESPAMSYYFISGKLYSWK